MKNCGVDDFDDIYKDLFLQFPPCELKSRSQFDLLLKKPEYKLVIAKFNKENVGYLLFWESDFIWVDYLAIFKKFHGCGFGTRILNAFFEKIKSVKGVYFEVEKPNSAQVNTIKRIKFYERLGCKTLDFEYLYPNNIKKFPMNLMFYSQKSIPSKKEILSDVKVIFEKIHGGFDDVLEEIISLNSN